MRWVARRASFDFDANGKPIRMLGTAHDVTERRFALERMRYLLELVLFAVVGGKAAVQEVQTFLKTRKGE